MSPKFKKLYLIITIYTLVAGLYGILHDQITYSISPEYYTKFKFYQFGLEESFFNAPRLGVAVVGFLATWWMGLVIGMVVGLFSLLHTTAHLMSKAIRSLQITLLLAVFTPAILIPVDFYGMYFSGGSMKSSRCCLRILPRQEPSFMMLLHIIW